jgi:hypothetical protein
MDMVFDRENVPISLFLEMWILSSIAHKTLQAQKAVAEQESTMSSTLDGYDEYRAFMDKLAVTNVDKYIDLPMIAVNG